MEKVSVMLTKTQLSFLEYFKTKIAAGCKFIPYVEKGHFGKDFALKKEYKDIEIISFGELKKKNIKCRVLFFSILRILASGLEIIINCFSKNEINNSLTVIVENLENIYLGVSKNNEFIKYLNIRKNSQKKFRIKTVLKIDENDILDKEDLDCVKLILSLINQGDINNLIVLISDKVCDLLGNIVFLSEDIKTFELTGEDLNKILSNNYQSNLNITSPLMSVARTIGIKFIIDNYKLFLYLDEKAVES